MKKYIIRKKFYVYNDEGHELILPTELVAVLHDKNKAFSVKSKLEKDAYISYLTQIIGISDYPFEHHETWIIIRDFQEKYPYFKSVYEKVGSNITDYGQTNTINPFENEQQMEELMKACNHDFYILEEVEEEKLHYVVLRNDEFWKDYENKNWIYKFSYDWVLGPEEYNTKKLSFKNREESLRYAYCETIDNLPYRNKDLESDFPDLLKHFYENSKYIKFNYEDNSLGFTIHFDFNMAIFENTNF